MAWKNWMGKAVKNIVERPEMRKESPENTGGGEPFLPGTESQKGTMDTAEAP